MMMISEIMFEVFQPLHKCDDVHHLGLEGRQPFCVGGPYFSSFYREPP